MLSSCLLSGLGIGILSTGLYALIIDKEEDRFLKNGNKDRNKDRKMEYCIIFSIILVVSVLTLYFTGDTTDKLIPMKGGSSTKSPTMNNNPPF